MPIVVQVCADSTFQAVRSTDRNFCTIQHDADVRELFKTHQHVMQDLVLEGQVIVHFNAEKIFVLSFRVVLTVDGYIP